MALYEANTNDFKFFLFSFILLSQKSLQPSLAEIAWQGNWAYACDFPGNDLTNEPATGAECRERCEKHPKCTHFSYSPAGGGTCFLKQGPITKSRAVEYSEPSLVCGVSLRGNSVPSTPRQGTTTRYWDCCKPSCAWPGKGKPSSPVVETCEKNGVTELSDPNAVSGCDEGEAYVCNDNIPWVVNERLAMGYAAANIKGMNESDWCCACYKLDFTSGRIAGKSMVVQITNSGGMAQENHFNLQIPGGGMGTHDGCTTQWNTSRAIWGETYGGLAERTGCDALPKAIREGCYFRFDWFQGASNPGVTFSAVKCPTELEERSQCKRLVPSTMTGESLVTELIPRESTTGDESDVKNKVIIGVLAVLGVLIVFGSCAAGFWLRRRAQMRGSMKRGRDQEMDNNILYTTHPSTRRLLGRSSNPAVAEYAKLLDVARETVEIGETVLGKGHYGIVYKALAFKLPTVLKIPVVVAVKVLQCADMDKEAEAQFAAEFRIMLKAGRHVNIVNILGIVQQNKPMLILEYCKFGSLLTYLKNHRNGLMYSHVDENGHILPFNEGEMKRQQSEAVGVDYRVLDCDGMLSTADLIRFAHQISRGMAYLSSRSIIHRDLAARNILVAENKIVKISDFGLARHGEEFYTASSPFLALPILWMPPEAITTRLFSQKSDVWSFSVTLWEIFSLAEVPFDRLNVVKFSANAFADWLAAGNQMPRTAGTPLAVYELMQRCWSVEPTSRPTFSELWDCLDKVVDAMSRPEHGFYLHVLEAVNPTTLLEDQMAELSERILSIPDD